MGVVDFGILDCRFSSPDRGGAAEPGGVLCKFRGGPGVNGGGRFAEAFAVAPGRGLRNEGFREAVETQLRASPGASEIVVEGGVDQLHGATTSTGAGRPGKADAVFDAVLFGSGGIEKLE